MDFGIRVKNEDQVLQVDSDYKNLCLRYSGTLQLRYTFLPGMREEIQAAAGWDVSIMPRLFAYVKVTCSPAATIAICDHAPDDVSGSDYLYIVGGMMVTAIRDDVAGQTMFLIHGISILNQEDGDPYPLPHAPGNLPLRWVEYYIFDAPQPINAESWAMRVNNAQGQETFNSLQYPLVVLDSRYGVIGQNQGPGPIHQHNSASGRKIALLSGAYRFLWNMFTNNVTYWGWAECSSFSVYTDGPTGSQTIYFHTASMSEEFNTAAIQHDTPLELGHYMYSYSIVDITNLPLGYSW
ncbi:hypothetical protein ACKF11_08830 [Methylobacillus sp. Pita2]|uniref:hypothetical protein n=1 Tax=Methylobacillus sp. Pita2 TaxID=3383245 RepID=UPI0038B66CFD